MTELVIIFVSIFAGFIGSLLGLGGGVIIVPFLTLVLHIDIRYAVAASLISIVATSSGAAAGFLKDRLTNVRVAIILEVGTVLGAATGFLLSRRIESKQLFLIFGGFLLVSAFLMFRKKKDSRAAGNHPWAEKLNLQGSFPGHDGKMISYNVAQVPFGLISMYFAGILSALLGIGSGIFKVMAMDGAMRLPMKVSSATSNFMIGVTATASAGAYLLSGDIQPEVACPVALGIICGSWIGGKTMPHLPTELIRKIFVTVLVVVSIQMIFRGVRS